MAGIHQALRQVWIIEMLRKNIAAMMLRMHPDTDAPGVFTHGHRFRRTNRPLAFAKEFNIGGKQMVKHIILWQLKDELSDSEKDTVKKEIKEGLEGLVGKVPGLLEVHVQTTHLDSSNCDLMLNCTLEDEASLKGYAVHPAHLAVANGKVRPYTKSRMCIDYTVD